MHRVNLFCGGVSMKWLSDFLWALFRPNCWLRNYPTSPALSAWINERLDAGDKPEWIDHHVSSLSGVTLWTCNYPYAYGSFYGQGGPSQILPDRRTTHRLYHAIVRPDSDENVSKFLARRK